LEKTAAQKCHGLQYCYSISTINNLCHLAKYVL